MGIADDLLLASFLGLPALAIGTWLGAELRARGASASGVLAVGAIAGLVCGAAVVLVLVVQVDHSDDPNAALALLGVPPALLLNVLAGLAGSLLGGVRSGVDRR